MQPLEPMATTLSGMSKVPDALAYPRILTLNEVPEIEGQFVYVIKAYPEDGLAITIFRDQEEVYLSINDFLKIVLLKNLKPHVLTSIFVSIRLPMGQLRLKCHVSIEDVIYINKNWCCYR